MTAFALRSIPIFILIVALRIAFGSDAAMSQTAPACTNDLRYVRMLGT